MSDLNEAVHQLEMMRQRGELTADAVAEMMGQYLSTASAASSTARPNRHQNVSSTLVIETWENNFYLVRISRKSNSKDRVKNRGQSQNWSGQRSMDDILSERRLRCNTNGPPAHTSTGVALEGSRV